MPLTKADIKIISILLASIAVPVLIMMVIEYYAVTTLEMPIPVKRFLESIFWFLAIPKISLVTFCYRRFGIWKRIDQLIEKYGQA
jgi:hypothetical protein